MQPWSKHGQQTQRSRTPRALGGRVTICTQGAFTIQYDWANTGSVSCHFRRFKACIQSHMPNIHQTSPWVVIQVEDNGVFGYMHCWNAKMETAVALPRHKSLPQKVQVCIRNSPKPLYSGSLSISTAKFADLQVLKQFCDPRNANFFDLLPTDGALLNSLHQELSDSESDSEEDERQFFFTWWFFLQGTPSFSIYFSTIHYHFPYPSPFSLCCWCLCIFSVVLKFTLFSFSILKFCSSQNKIETLF